MTSDHENYTHEHHHIISNSTDPFSGSGEVLYAIRVSVVTLLILLTFFLNSSLLCVLWRVRYTKVIRDDGCGHYIINLCVIDLLAAVICSICTALYKLTTRCSQFKMVWVTSSALQILLSSGWIATVAVMMRDRLRIANNPLLKRRTFWRMTYGIVIAWCWAAANTSPQFFLQDYISVDVHWKCPHVHDDSHSHKVLYSLIRIVLMFLLPSSIILISSFGILRHHFTAENSLSLKRKKGHQRFVYLVFLLWVTFTVSNLPKHLLELGFIFNDAHTQVERYEREQIIMYILIVSWSIHMISPIAYFVAYKDILQHEMRELAKQSSCLQRFWPTTGKKMIVNSKNVMASPYNAMDDFDWESCFNQNMYLLQNLGLLENLNKKPVLNKKMSIFSSNDEGPGMLVAGMRRVSQPLIKKKSVVDQPVNPYVVSTHKHSVHTLNQRVLLEEDEDDFKSSKRKLPTIFNS